MLNNDSNEQIEASTGIINTVASALAKVGRNIFMTGQTLLFSRSRSSSSSSQQSIPSIRPEDWAKLDPFDIENISLPSNNSSITPGYSSYEVVPELLHRFASNPGLIEDYKAAYPDRVAELEQLARSILPHDQKMPQIVYVPEPPILKRGRSNSI